jgi:MFS transporter, Spinster family, sphingosine-1-phosphate transporter
VAASDPRYKWRLVAFLFFVAALNYGDRTATSAVFPLLRRDLGMSDLQLAAVGSFFLWSYAIGSPLAGYLADRISRSRLVAWSLGAWSLVTLATGMAPNAEILLATRALLGIAECLYLPAAIALLADHHPSETRATAMGLHIAGLSVGLVAGGAMAGYFGEHYGWRLSFYLLGGIGLVMAAAAPFVLRDAAPKSEEAAAGGPPVSSNLSLIVRIPSFWILLLQAMIVSIGTWIFFNWLPLYFNEAYHLSLAGAGFSAPLVIQGSGVAGVAFGGWFSDRVAGTQPARRMLAQSLFYFAAAPFLLAFLNRPVFPILIACIFCFSMLRALGGSNENAMLCDLLPPRLRSTAVGLTNAANTFAGGVGVLVAGYLKRDYGLGGIFGGISAIMALGALLLLIGYLWFVRRDLARFQAHTFALH